MKKKLRFCLEVFDSLRDENKAVVFILMLLILILVVFAFTKNILQAFGVITVGSLIIYSVCDVIYIIYKFIVDVKESIDYVRDSEEK